MKRQNANDRLDEHLGMKDGKESTKSQSYKDRRDESRGMTSSKGGSTFDSVFKSMEAKNRSAGGHSSCNKPMA